MSNLSTEISYLLRIAIDINKKIGGTKAYGNFQFIFRGIKESKR